jgi:hypothetical protein
MRTRSTRSIPAQQSVLHWQACYMLQGGVIVGRFNQDYARALACNSAR